MDSNDIFLRLQQGARFNKKKYERDMDFFQVRCGAAGRQRVG